MSIDPRELISLIRALTSVSADEREDACGTVTDWLGSFSAFEVRAVSAVLAASAVAEPVPTCRESQLHALVELMDTGHVSGDAVEPVRSMSEDGLGVSEQEYVREIRQAYF